MKDILGPAKRFKTVFLAVEKRILLRVRHVKFYHSNEHIIERIPLIFAVNTCRQVKSIQKAVIGFKSLSFSKKKSLFLALLRTKTKCLTKFSLRTLPSLFRIFFACAVPAKSAGLASANHRARFRFSQSSLVNSYSPAAAI